MSEIDRTVDEAYRALTLSSLTAAELQLALAELTRKINSIPMKTVTR